jgi:2-oxoglutarate ferredoxin oxidoreductase subunit alpha
MDNKDNLKDVTIRFTGDSGDGMQLVGTLFSDTSALFGNDISTFPDFPSEIRAPQGTVSGVSGFQVHIGQKLVHTPGDYCDLLVAMNPAALKANLKWCKKGATIIVDVDSFGDRNLTKAEYDSNPLEDETLVGYNVIPAPISSQTQEALKDTDLDNKSILRSKNMFALGIMYSLYNKPLDYTNAYFEKKFAKKPEIISANKTVLKEGFLYAENVHALPSSHIAPADIEPGTYKNLNGNTATAWGLLAAAEKVGLPLFLGSYPITPATDILSELSKYKNLGVRTFQAEDEIAGICTSIGASYSGSLAVTTTSGPGLALKGEAIGLAVMMELPLVIVDVQRGGPSTGLPTKTEQSDLMQALYGRNGEAPCIVIAAKSPSDCFNMAYIASKLSIEHMTPVILLTDGYIANGSSPWKIQQ